MTLTAAPPTPLVESGPIPATVFIVDDDPAVRKSLRWLVESVGLPVLTFASGQEFLDAYDPARAGCLVTDVRMPGMDGLQLQERLRQLGCRLPMIIMTAYGDVPMAVRAMKTGAIHFFEKPINNQLLLDQIRIALEHDGERTLDAAAQQQAEVRYRRLTKRELQVLSQVVNGLSSKEIGAVLNVSYKTIEAHRSKIMRKMETQNVPHLIRTYLEIPEARRAAIEAQAKGGEPEPTETDDLGFA